MNSIPAGSKNRKTERSQRSRRGFCFPWSFTSLSLLVTMLFAVFIIVAGCGKKGPPKPPRYVPPPVVDNLEAAVKDGKVVLSWTVAARKDLPPSARPAGCVVYRSKTAIADAACLDCPVVFEKAAEVVLETSGRLQWGENVDAGYRYIYKVKVQTETDAMGGDSNSVEFIVPNP